MLVGVLVLVLLQVLLLLPAVCTQSAAAGRAATVDVDAFAAVRGGWLLFRGVGRTCRRILLIAVLNTPLAIVRNC